MAKIKSIETLKIMIPKNYEWLKEIGTLPKMIEAALQYIGIKEVPGSKANPIILDMAKGLGIENIYKSDEMPWCGLLINHLIRITGKPMLDVKNDPYNYLRAKYMLNWGNKIEVKDMLLGDIGILNREGGGHVFLIIAKTKTGNVIGLGGNQSNSFTFSEFDIKRIVGVRRYYATQPPASAKLYVVESDGKVSNNEA